MLTCITGRIGAVTAIVCTVALMHARSVLAADPPPAYRVTRTVALGAPDRWDYVVFDPDSGRVFVAHGDEVTVVNGDNGTIVGQVIGFPGGTHGIAIVGSSGRGYTDDGKAGEAASFNLGTLAVEKRIKTAAGADAVTFDPASRHVFVVDGDTGILTVIDPVTNETVSDITVGGGLEYAVPDGRGQLYVNGAERQEVVRVDTLSNTVSARWPIPQCVRPHGLALDPNTRRLFVSCVNNTLVVVNAQSGEAMTTLPIGSGTDAVAFDPHRKLIFSSNGRDGTLSIIREVDAQTFISVGSVKTPITARTMALNPATGRLYIAAAEVAQSDAAGATHPAVVPGSLKLMFLDPVN